MITSLQNFFLKHNKWLFGGLLIVIIVTFVLTIGPQSFFGSNASGQRRSLNYYGYDLTSEQDQRAMAHTAEISAILHPELQLRREQLMDYAYLRVAALGMAKQLGIPSPGEAELSEYVATLLIFADPATGEFTAESYNRMLEAFQNDGRFTRKAIARTLREDYTIEQVRNILGGPDYVLPFETQQSYIDMETAYTLNLAHYSYADFAPEIAPSNEALQQYFSENPSRYEIQETISVSALQFKKEAYIDSISEPTTGELEVYFASNQAQYQPEASGETTPELTLEEVRAQVASDWKVAQAVKLAARKGEAFSLRLWQEGIALDSPEFEALVKEFAVTSAEIPAYSRGQVPAGSALAPQLLESMWVYASNPNRYFSDAAQTADGAVLLVLRGLTEARTPAFEEVLTAVEADYRVAEKRRLFALEGIELQATIEGRLGSESFSAVAESLGLTVADPDTFKGSEVPQELLQSRLWDQTMHMKKGAVTPMVINGDRGSFAYMADKVVPVIEKDSEAYRTFVENRKGALSESMGWARLREITDNSLSALMSSPVSE
ncbi:MAG: hypothetical protein ACO3ZW_06575 [Opitutales bacterium]|jgi:hypothetical protein